MASRVAVLDALTLDSLLCEDLTDIATSAVQLLVGSEPFQIRMPVNACLALLLCGVPLLSGGRLATPGERAFGLRPDARPTVATLLSLGSMARLLLDNSHRLGRRVASALELLDAIAFVALLMRRSTPPPQPASGGGCGAPLSPIFGAVALAAVSSELRRLYSDAAGAANWPMLLFLLRQRVAQLYARLATRLRFKHSAAESAAQTALDSGGVPTDTRASQTSGSAPSALASLDACTVCRLPPTNPVGYAGCAHTFCYLCSVHASRSRPPITGTDGAAAASRCPLCGSRGFP